MNKVRKTSRMGFRGKVAWVFFFISLFVFTARASISDDFTNYRITAGTKIFRALLAADSAIAGKTASDGNLRLCLLYTDNRRVADMTADILRNHSGAGIRHVGIRIETMTVSRFIDDGKERIAGVFLTQHLDKEQLKLVIRHSASRHIVVFSPFAGDVERGVQGGLSVEAQVRPYVNMRAVKAAGIRLKSFFLMVAKQYE